MDLRIQIALIVTLDIDSQQVIPAKNALIIAKYVSKRNQNVLNVTLDTFKHQINYAKNVSITVSNVIIRIHALPANQDILLLAQQAVLSVYKVAKHVEQMIYQIVRHALMIIIKIVKLDCVSLAQISAQVVHQMENASNVGQGIL